MRSRQTWSTPVPPVLIAALVVLEVAVWQVRVALATRGRKRIAAPLGAVNAVISVVALGQVVTHLDRPENVAGYALGVAIGVYVGVAARPEGRGGLGRARQRGRRLDAAAPRQLLVRGRERAR
jgi:uncharacterized protein YebE (UPF0316 family)